MRKADVLRAQVAEAAGSRRAPPIESTAVPAAKARPGREQLVMIAGHFPREVRKQLHQIALDHDTTAQKLLGEALNLLFEHYHKPEIAPSKPLARR